VTCITIYKLRFYVPLNTKWVISETFPKPISWLCMEKLNLTPQKHAFTNQEKCTTTHNKHKKVQPGLVTFYDMLPGNGVGLFSKKISKGENKYRRSEQVHQHAFKTQIPPHGLKQRRRHQLPMPTDPRHSCRTTRTRRATSPKSTNESRAHYAPEPARGC